jgi:DNA-binding MarR family transcriptional regulator
VNLSADDAELVQLLGQLLRVVSPESAGPGHGGSGPGDGQARPDGVAADGPAARDTTADGPAADGSAAKGPAADRPAAAGPAVLGSGDRDRSAGEAAEIPIPTPSASEARALIELVAARGIAQGQLGTLLGLEKSTVSRLAAGLERKGWVRRGRDEANQRYIRLYLTPEGSRVAARIWSAWQTRQARILAALSTEERAGLASGLRGLIRGLAAEGLVADVPSSGDGPVPEGAVPDSAVSDGAAADGAASAPVRRG